MAEKNTPNPVDVHVGARVRYMRKALGMSQTELADALGLTFQQVQKYELGTNRVSASKLYEIAKKMKVTIGFFFEGLEATQGDNNDAAVKIDRNLNEAMAVMIDVPSLMSLSKLSRPKLVIVGNLVESMIGEAA
jgi:transcriptional regulator with XRE-family HTH domain